MQCPNISTVTLDLRELLLCHLIYNPLLFLLRNNELKDIFNDLIMHR